MKSTLTLMLCLASFSVFAKTTLDCGGTEPFWGIKVDQNGFVKYSSPDMENPKFFSKSTKISAAGTGANFAYQLIATNMKNESIKLNITTAECNDGMSDEIYPQTVLVEDNGAILYGCCK